MIKIIVYFCYSSRGKALASLWVVENDAPFYSSIFLSAAVLKFIRRLIFLMHAWLISFLELDEALSSVSSFKIYRPRLLEQRFTEGEFIIRKNPRHLSNKRTTVLLLHFPTNSVNNGKTRSSIMRVFSS